MILPVILSAPSHLTGFLSYPPRPCPPRQSGLSSAVMRSGMDGAAQSVDPDDAPLDGIMATADEIRLWADLAGDHRLDPALRERAAAVAGVLEPLQGAFGGGGGLNAATTEALLDAMDEAASAVEALWFLESPGGGRKFAYGQRRLAHLMDRVGDDFASTIRFRLRKAQLWVAPSEASEEGAGVEALLGSLMPLASGWANAVARLTTDWATTHRKWHAHPHSLHATPPPFSFHFHSFCICTPKMASPCASHHTRIRINSPLGYPPPQGGRPPRPLWASGALAPPRRDRLSPQHGTGPLLSLILILPSPNAADAHPHCSAQLYKVVRVTW